MATLSTGMRVRLVQDVTLDDQYADKLITYRAGHQGKVVHVSKHILTPGEPPYPVAYVSFDARDDSDIQRNYWQSTSLFAPVYVGEDPPHTASPLHDTELLKSATVKADDITVGSWVRTKAAWFVTPGKDSNLLRGAESINLPRNSHGRVKLVRGEGDHRSLLIEYPGIHVSEDDWDGEPVELQVWTAPDVVELAIAKEAFAKEEVPPLQYRYSSVSFADGDTRRELLEYLRSHFERSYGGKVAADILAFYERDYVPLATVKLLFLAHFSDYRKIADCDEAFHKTVDRLTRTALATLTTTPAIAAQHRRPAHLEC